MACKQPRVRPPRPERSFMVGHEKISAGILPLLLIQEEQLSVSGERSALSTGKLPRRLAQEQSG